MNNFTNFIGIASLVWAAVAAKAADDPHPPIPIRFTLKEPGFVTLVIEDPSGKRVRNLVAETPFPAGLNTAWWDGADESGGVHEDSDGVYRTRGKLVEPGAYQARGLFRKQIDLRYEFTAYSEGTPPWRTADKTGRWLADHTPPSDVLFLPGSAGQAGQVLIASFVAESGDGLVWTDLAGRKRRGQRWAGGVWTGASHLARDKSARAVPGVDAYAASSWLGGDGKSPDAPGQLRFVALLSNGKDQTVLTHEFDRKALQNKTAGHNPATTPSATNDLEKEYVGGLAAHDGLLVASLFRHGQLMFIDAAGGKKLGTAPMADPRGVAFDSRGRLLVLAGRELRRYALPSRLDGAVTLPPPQVLVARGLEVPRGLALDGDGNVYISDWGNSHQVKVFDADGKPLRVIGKPGAPKAGPYDPAHMNHPNGLTITGDNRLWVAEKDYLPKRVSVWTLDGQLVKGLYGPSHYGGGGTIDSRDKTRFYLADEKGGGVMEFRLDWDKGESQLASVPWRSGETAPPSMGPQWPLYFEGRQYMTNAFNNHPVYGPRVLGLWQMKNGLAVPVAAVGNAYQWKLLHGDAFQSRWPQVPGKAQTIDLTSASAAYKSGNPVVFAWSDRNDDARVQPEETTFRRVSTPQPGEWYLTPDLNLFNSFTLHLRPQGFSPGGAPLYDVATAQTRIPDLTVRFTSGARVAMTTGDGRTLLTGGPLRGFENDRLMWTYPNAWPGLHDGHHAPPQQYPGQLIATTRPLGWPIRVPGAQVGELWAYNGDPGHIYLLTTDGLFVAQLFKNGHKAKHPHWDELPARRGLLLNDVAKHGEDFWPTFNRTADGNVYLVAGKEHSSIVRVDGLETLRRIAPVAFKITPDLLQQASAYAVRHDALRQEKQGKNTLVVVLRSAAPAVDGKLEDWGDAAWVSLDANTQASIAVAGDRLYAAFRTQDKNLLANSGESLPLLFKTGGALDLMIGANATADPKRTKPVAGDLRLLVTRAGDKTMAALYRPVAANPKPIPFASPWRTVTFDRVDDVSAGVTLASHKRAEDVKIKKVTKRVHWEEHEFSIPLASLGLKPEAGRTVSGDLGVLRGSDGETRQRLYWHNKATGLVNDVPGEAMLTPGLWGRWQFTAERRP